MKTAKILGFLAGILAAWSLASASTVGIDSGYAEGTVPGPFNTTLYVRGSIVNDWATGPENAMTWDGDSYVWSVVLTPGTYNFKIADDNWTDGINFGTQTGVSGVIELGVLTDQGNGCCAGDWALTILTEMKYIFDYTPFVGSSMEGQLIITPIPAAFLLFGSALMGLGVIRRRKS